MEHRAGRPGAANDIRGVRRRWLSERPDYVALWAVAMAIVAMIAAAASAQAGSGGYAISGDCKSADFGDRSLRRGDCGDDVKTLNWVLKAKDYGVRLERNFENPTDDSVRAFQRRKDLTVDGVVGHSTRKALRGSMNRSVATWYGPGFYGNQTACGRTLTRDTIGVAHRTLPCGTKVTLNYRGRWVRARVIDRGPYSNDANWDLTEKTANKLNFSYTDAIRVAPIN